METFPTLERLIGVNKIIAVKITSFSTRHLLCIGLNDSLIKCGIVSFGCLTKSEKRYLMPYITDVLYINGGTQWLGLDP